MIIEKLANWWGVKDSLPSKVDLVVMVSYGADEFALTIGTYFIAEKTEKTKIRFPNAKVVFGVFTHSLNPKIEELAKKRMFRDAVFVGLVASTIEECQKVRALIREQTGTIVVVTGECHSRTARLVWETYFPNSEIYIITIPIVMEIDPGNPMIFLRHKWTWFLVNILRHLVFRVVGVTRMERFKLRQPTFS